MTEIIIGVAAGGICGFLFHKFVGCRGGTCRIIGSPYLSTLYGAVLGGLVANLLF